VLEEERLRQRPDLALEARVDVVNHDRVDAEILEALIGIQLCRI
jgi:hypothetical protein